MEATAQQPPNRYALVSSLYGPGTIACWYLTILSVLVSWTLHPKKKKSGSIDVDLMAILTLPTVAVGHLIWQVSKLMQNRDDPQNSSIRPDQYAQVIAAVEAPFSVIESFMAISVILFLIAAWMFCIRRLICVAVVGLLCFVTECYVHFSSFKELGIQYNASVSVGDNRPTFSRSFVADFTGLVIAIMAILALCAALASAIFTFMLSSRRARTEVVRAERGALGERSEISDEEFDMELLKKKSVEAERASRRATLMSLVLLPITALLTAIPSASNAIHFSNSVLALTGRATIYELWSRLKIFASHFYPHSSNSFSDLDQALTTAAGAITLGFSVYSVAKVRYMTQTIAQTRRAEGNENELHRLDGD